MNGSIPTNALKRFPLFQFQSPFPPAEAQDFVGVVVVVQRDTELLQVVGALGPRRPSEPPGSRKQKRHKNADDRNHDQQLNQGERTRRRNLSIRDSLERTGFFEEITAANEPL